MKPHYVSHGRSVSDLKAHLVLTTKYRRKVFTAPVLKRLHEIFEDLLQKWDCLLVEFNGERDHIHLLFQYHPSVELAKLVNNLKTVTSRRLRSEFSEIEQSYRKDVLWNSSYFIASCGGVTLTTLMAYIQGQDTPTGEGS